MLIRSQKKGALTNDLNLSIYQSNWNRSIYEISNKAVGTIGEYTSKEKAFKVLDIIQNTYADGNEWLSAAGKVFQMPADEDVEV